MSNTLVPIEFHHYIFPRLQNVLLCRYIVNLIISEGKINSHQHLRDAINFQMVDLLRMRVFGFFCFFFIFFSVCPSGWCDISRHVLWSPMFHVIKLLRKCLIEGTTYTLVVFYCVLFYTAHSTWSPPVGSGGWGDIVGLWQC